MFKTKQTPAGRASDFYTSPKANEDRIPFSGWVAIVSIALFVLMLMHLGVAFGY